MRNTVTVRELIKRLQNEDPDAKVVFASNYGDRCRTQQVHFIEGDFEESLVRKSGYSDSGYALADDDEDNDDDEQGDDYDARKVLVLS